MGLPGAGYNCPIRMKDENPPLATLSFLVSPQEEVGGASLQVGKCGVGAGRVLDSPINFSWCGWRQGFLPVCILGCDFWLE